MVAFIISMLVKTGMAEETARKASKPILWGAGIGAAAALLFVVLPLIWTGIKNNIVEDKVTEANEEFGQRKDAASGKADLVSEADSVIVQKKISETVRLIDEAIEKNCAVADYLASGGAVCLRPNRD